MQKTDNNSRRDFLKKIPFAMVSISTFSFLNFKKSKTYSENKYNTLSKSEADEIIKNNNSPASTKMNPAPIPLGQKNIS